MLHPINSDRKRRNLQVPPSFLSRPGKLDLSGCLQSAGKLLLRWETCCAIIALKRYRAPALEIVSGDSMVYTAVRREAPLTFGRGCMRRRISMIPKDPVMLLSYLNTQLRDFYPSLEALCEDKQLNLAEVCSTLQTIDYEYDGKRNQFV